MPIPRKVTSAYLKRHGACAPGRRRFERAFPQGVRLTKANIIKYGHRFDLAWLCARGGAIHPRFHSLTGMRQRELEQKRIGAGYLFPGGFNAARETRARAAYRKAMSPLYYEVIADSWAKEKAKKARVKARPAKAKA